MNFLASPGSRAAIIAVLAVVIALFSYFIVVQPALTQYDQSNQRLQQDTTTYNSLKTVADQKPQYLALIKQIQVQLASVTLTADPRVYIPSYLKQIEDLAKQDGLQVTSVTPQAAPTTAPNASPAPGAVATVAPQVSGGVSAIAPIASAQRVAGAANAQAGVTNSVATATGATPIPGSAGASGGTPTRMGGAAMNVTATNTARANAIAYLNQSFSQVPINMELSGTYTQFEKFLRDLNKFPKLIGVGNVTMSPGSNNAVGETPTLSIILPIVAYRLSPSTQSVTTPAVPAQAGGNGG